MTTGESIRIEQARLIHRNMPTAVIGGFLVAALTALVFARVTPVASVLGWLLACALASTYRMSVWKRYRTSLATHDDATRWLRQSMIGAAANGTLWGVGFFVVSPADMVDYQLLFVWAAVMMTVAAMFSFSVHYPSFLAFMIPWSVIGAVELAGHMTVWHWAIALGIPIFSVVAARFMFTFSQVFQETLKLRFENVELVAQLTKQKEAAEAANLAKSRFLAVASHDLRQPMHALNLYVGTLAGLDLSERARKLLANVRQCGEAMDKMFRALLDVSRLDAGIIQPETRAFAMQPMLERVRMEFEPQARNKGLELRVVNSSATVHSDPAMVERMLRNLVLNAILHTGSGKVLVGCRRRKGRLNVRVYDTGPGIPRELHGKVFQEFFQIGNPERDRTKGLGLGLAIVERLAKLLSAPVKLESEPGKGAMFAFELPRVRQDDVPAHMRTDPNMRARKNFEGMMVVVIDDEAPVLDAMRGLLEMWGCRVVTASSGSEALKKLGSITRVPDMLVCDYRLRDDEDGIGVIGALRAEFNDDIPAMLITGDTGPERIREIQGSGLTVLHKPLQENELRSALARLARQPGQSILEDAESARDQDGLRAVGHV
ncbi:MAG TPA: hybrid sensor histidine kinase/response regulator [Burkholderiales bacterium]|nr:hybrid sensor histidine kinase/response regulator [Burkholderiales bacterium]